MPDPKPVPREEIDFIRVIERHMAGHALTIPRVYVMRVLQYTDALVDALRPFAIDIDPCGEGDLYEDDHVLALPPTFTVGQVRRARALVDDKETT